MLVCLVLTGSMDHKVVDDSFDPDTAQAATVPLWLCLLSPHCSYTLVFSTSLNYQHLIGELCMEHSVIPAPRRQKQDYQCTLKASLGITVSSRPVRANSETLHYKQKPKPIKQHPLKLFIFILYGMRDAPDGECLMNRMVNNLSHFQV